MNKQMTLGQYRALDIAMLSGAYAVCEILIYVASTFWYARELYIASPVAIVTALVMMRWGIWAGIPALGGGLLYACLRQGTWQQLLTYGAGNLLALTALILFRLLGKERIRKSAFLSMMYALSVQLLMQAGRALVAAVLGTDIGAALGYITTDILSTLLTVVIIWIARKPDGLFEDQKHYLLRLQSERQVEGRE